MPIFNRNNPADMQAIEAAQQLTVECFNRYQLCKTKLDSLNKHAVRHWLERLPEAERERCRNVLNKIHEGKCRSAKTEKPAPSAKISPEDHKQIRE